MFVQNKIFPELVRNSIPWYFDELIRIATNAVFDSNAKQCFVLKFWLLSKLLETAYVAVLGMHILSHVNKAWNRALEKITCYILHVNDYYHLSWRSPMSHPRTRSGARMVPIRPASFLGMFSVLTISCKWIGVRCNCTKRIKSICCNWELYPNKL